MPRQEPNQVQVDAIEFTDKNFSLNVGKRTYSKVTMLAGQELVTYQHRTTIRKGELVAKSLSIHSF